MWSWRLWEEDLVVRLARVVASEVPPYGLRVLVALGPRLAARRYGFQVPPLTEFVGAVVVGFRGGWNLGLQGFAGAGSWVGLGRSG